MRSRARRRRTSIPRIEAADARSAARAGGVRPAGGRCRSGPGLVSLAWPRWSPTCARWARPTSSPRDRVFSIANRPWPRPPDISCKPATASARREVLKFFILPRGRRRRMMPALTLSRARVVNPNMDKPAVWTWTRGGWRDRYPKDFAHARRRPAWGYRDRIWLDCCAHHRCDDGRAQHRLAAAPAPCGASFKTRRSRCRAASPP